MKTRRASMTIAINDCDQWREINAYTGEVRPANKQVMIEFENIRHIRRNKESNNDDDDNLYTRKKAVRIVSQQS